MLYEEINRLYRKVEQERFRDVGANAEYTYLEEELYALRIKGEEPITFLRARSPKEAHEKFLRRLY